MSLEDKKELTYQLYQLVAAGLPIYESLISLREKKLRYDSLISQIAEDIKKGHSISQSFQSNYPEFGSVYFAVLQAAENSGELKEGFYALKELLQRQYKLTKTLKQSLSYPVILLVFAFLIVHVMILFVIPSLSELFEGREVNLLTEFVLNISAFCTKNLLGLSVIYMVIALSGFYLKQKNKLGYVLMKFLQKFQSIEQLFTHYKFENFFYCLSMLLNRGITLKKALELAESILRFTKYEKDLQLAMQNLLNGKKFSESLPNSFPFIIKRFISLSESTGNLGESCLMLSEIFENDLEKKLQKLTTLLQPILLALIGLIIGFVILAILLPLTDAGNLNI